MFSEQMMEGVLLVDKPKGLSSFDVVRKIKFLTGIKKIGHTGTLDPMATGLLVICLGRYTKLVSLLMDADKIYESVFTLGVSTTTDDVEGDIIGSAAIHNVNESIISDSLRNFCGKIQQVPPKYSAIKVGGQRAYKLARRGECAELKPRWVEIFSLSLRALALPEIDVRIHCSKGTYIRAIARDLGYALGVGAHAKEIRRVRSGGFSVDHAVPFLSLDKKVIRDNMLFNLNAVTNIERVNISAYDKEAIRRGQKNICFAKMQSRMGLAICDDEIIAILHNSAMGCQIARVM